MQPGYLLGPPPSLGYLPATLGGLVASAFAVATGDPDAYRTEHPRCLPQDREPGSGTVTKRSTARPK